MRRSISRLAAMVALLGFAVPGHATVWVWSFDKEVGTFVTDGSGSEAGTYNLLEFSVTSSAAGATIGNTTTGAYTAGSASLNTIQPFSFDWDGSRITQFHHAGGNTGNWFVFQENLRPIFFYQFAANQDATYIDYSWGDTFARGPLTVVAVPEPTSLALMVAGLGVLWRWPAARRRTLTTPAAARRS